MFSHIKELFSRPSGYTIARSVRLRSSASAYFNRTPAVAGNQKTWTWSGWVKRGIVNAATTDMLFAVRNTGVTVYGYIAFSSDQLDVTFLAATYRRTTSAVYRDPSAWYHIVVAVDTTLSTSTDRIKIYVNGVQVTAFTTNSNGTQNANSDFNSTEVHAIGRYGALSANYLDGYLTEINFIDGQALTPSSFGSTNALTGVWQPAKYTGTYGTNGFYLNFSDNSNNTATTIGKDYSGNGNNWTPNNISVTSGSTYDSMTDVPTLTSATAANYPTWNPLVPSGQAAPTDGNLSQINSTGCRTATMPFPQSGKWYLEWLAGSNTMAIVVGSPFVPTTQANSQTYSVGYYNNGNKYIAGTATAYGASFTSGDIIGLALDFTVSPPTITYYKNNASQGSINLTSGIDYYVAAGIGGTGLEVINFGQRPFFYTPPTGYVALNTYNLPASTIKNGAAYMAATTYTGTGATQTISNSVNGISFQPDWVWTKARSAAIAGLVYDSVRGATKYLQTNSTSAEGTGADSLTAFASNGFTVGADTSTTGVNQNTTTYVGWNWKAGGTAVSNTSGSITSQVSANTTAGFSVVTYTGNATAGATIGHGLGVAPQMVIVKQRSGVQDWVVYHVSVGNTGALFLQSTSAVATNILYWNNTTPSSSVVTLGSGNGVNANAATYVAYCFAPVAGYSAFGSYTGNGSTDGPFVYLGFRPRFVMFKDSTSAGAWMIMDSSRETYNVEQNGLAPNNSNAESTYSGTPQVDFLSNGFKIRANNANAYWNNISGNTYIYAAFAEVPFKSALGR
jgi:hypothetical protein